MPHVALNGIDLYYEVHGEGPPLVMLHGFGSSTRDWELQVPALEADFRVVLVDLRGFGRTSRDRGPWSVDSFAADVLALLDHLEIDRFHLLGYSMGGAAAFQLAVDVPERIDRLVLVNTVPSFLADTLRKRAEVWMRKAVVRLMGMKRMAEVIAKRLFPEPDQQALRELVMDRYGDNEPKVYLGVLSSLPRWSVADRLDAIRSPTLVIAAEHDYTPVADKEAYVAKMHDARLEVFAGSRHGTPFDRTEQFNESVRSFLLPPA